jgi:membrane fusion protein (multidrug efflux system)
VLHARHHDGRTSELRLVAEQTIVGRQGADIELVDPGVCPRHAEILFKDGIVGVRDLGSRRGTWLGVRRVDRAVLRPGRSFRVGNTTFELRDIEGDADPLQTRLFTVQGGLGAQAAAPASAGVPPASPRMARPIIDVRASPASPVSTPSPVSMPHAGAASPPRVAAPQRGQVAREGAASREGAAAPRGAMVVRQGHGAPAVRSDAPARLVVADADPGARAWMERALGDEHEPRFVATAAEAYALAEQLAARGMRTVVVIGHRLADGSGEILARSLGAAPFAAAVARIVVDGIVVDDPTVFYRLRAGLGEAQLRAIVGAAVRVRRPPEAPPSSSTRAWASKVVFETCATASARSEPAAVATAIEEGIGRLVGSARVACIFHDAVTGTLWTEATETGMGRIEALDGHASAGIVGFVARTSASAMVPCVSADPRYDPRIDDPTGSGQQAMLAVAARAGGEVHAVLVAVREPGGGPFDAREGEALAHLGSELGPILHRLGRALDVDGALERIAQPPVMQLFRPEAVAAQLARREEGEVIRVAPGYSKLLYWVLVGMLLLGLVGLGTGEISQYSTGPAVVRQSGRAEVTALGAGAIASIEVGPGQRVRRGQVVARLRDVAERAQFDSARNDYDAQLRNRLLDPTDEAAAAQLRLLGRERDGALAALEQRVVRAPHDGIVTDIAATAGQHVDAGDVVMSVVDDSKAGLEVVAFLPGGDRPQIEIGMPLRLELLGFDYAWQDVVVDTITEGVIGPAEAKRLLGPQLADTVQMGGGVVMVKARLTGTKFVSGGVEYPYHDGMGGTAEVRMRDETILEMLIPGFEEL